jgi:hypothetical protein
VGNEKREGIEIEREEKDLKDVKKLCLKTPGLESIVRWEAASHLEANQENRKLNNKKRLRVINDCLKRDELEGLKTHHRLRKSKQENREEKSLTSVHRISVLFEEKTFPIKKKGVTPCGWTAGDWDRLSSEPVWLGVSKGAVRRPQATGPAGGYP